MLSLTPLKLLDWLAILVIAFLLLFWFAMIGLVVYLSTRSEVTAALMTMNPSAFILSEIGTGKTRAALYAIDFLLREGDHQVRPDRPRRSPRSPRSGTRRSSSIFPHLTTQILHGTREQRRAALATAGRHLHHQSRWHRDHTGGPMCIKEIQAIVIDELSYYQEWDDGSVEVYEQADYG